MCNVKLCRNYIETVYNQNRIVWVNKLRSFTSVYMFSDYKFGGEVPDNTDDNGSAASDPTSYEWS